MDTATLGTTYLGAWNEQDPEARAKILADTVTDDVLFVDNAYRTEGRAALEALIADVQAKFPGVTFAGEGEVDAHHEVARHAWTATLDGAVVLHGLDVHMTAADGRLAQIIGFYENG